MMLFGYLLPPALVQFVASLAAGAAVFFGWLALHDSKVVMKEQVRVATEGAKTSAKAQEKRRAVPTDGAVARVQSKYCRDC